MTKNIRSLSGSRVAFSLTVEEAAIKNMQKQVIQQHKGELKLKGFRKGHAPDEMVVAAVGESRIFQETFDRVLGDKYWDFVQQEGLKPVAHPKVDFSELKTPPVEVKIEVEVFPELSVGNYEKYKPKPLKVKVEEKEIDQAIKQLLVARHLEKPVERAAQKGDLVRVELVGKDKNGAVAWSGEGRPQGLLLGEGHFPKDMESALLGMKAGDTKEGAKVAFSKKESSPFAGQKLFFDIKVLSVGEVSLEDIDEAMIEKIMQKKASQEEFRKELHGILEREKKNQQRQVVLGEFRQQLCKITKGDLPASWIEKETQSRLQQMKASPLFQQDKEAFWKQVGTTEDKIVQELGQEAEKSLRIFLALSQIVEKEGIELNKDEWEQVKAQHERQTGQKIDSEKDEALGQTALGFKIDKFLDSLII